MKDRPANKPNQSYSEKLKDPRWQRKRLHILNSNDWRCEDCNRKDKSLEVHHTVYLRGKEPWEYGISELMCLCSDCHEWRQGREEAFRLALGRITRHLKPAQLDAEVWRILDDVRARETDRLSGGFQ